MTAERPTDVKPLVLVLLTAALGLALFVPTASAQDGACTDVLENRTEVENASATPGGLLADAIGDQRDEIGSQLGDGPLEARLDNATSDRERARIVAEEAERIRANVSTLERCWGINATEREANRSLAELDDDERAALENHTRSLRERLNATRAAADRLPVSVRYEHDVDRTTLSSLDRRLVAVKNATARDTRPSAWTFP